MALFAVGIVALLLAVIFLVIGIVQFARLQELESGKTSSVQELRTLAAQAPAASPPPCRIQGTVKSDHPFQAPFSELSCAAYVHTVVREREEEYEVNDGQGRSRTEKREISERLPDEGQRAPFWVSDTTGSILVDPAGAEMDLERTLERNEPGSYWQISRSRTRGYRRTEYVLRQGGTSFVSGYLVERRGQQMVAAHPDQGQRFMISYRSEQALTNAAMTWALVSLVLTVVLGLAGLILIGLNWSAVL
jgi:hypothetical protein